MAAPKGEAITSLRLIAGGGLAEGAYVAGIDLSMAKGSHTYWKNPGDAGVPPVFDLTASQNVAKAEVVYPAPTRLSEDGLETLGYLDRVIFPVTVTPRDATKPAVLSADVTYAVCNKVCIPAHGTAKLTLAPKGGDGDGADLIATAMKHVPVPIADDRRASFSIKRDPHAPKPTWTLIWSGVPPVDDIFADAPEGFTFDTKKRGPDHWDLIAVQSVGAPNNQRVPVSLVLARKQQSLLVVEPLDVAASTQ